MNGAREIRRLLEIYSVNIDESLRRLFSELPHYELYGHMAYFMGFKDAKLKPIETFGGKRFRSSLSMMLGDWYGVKKEALPAALSLELFHNFTLIHDDIVDGDTMRRGRETVWKVWGVPHAINSGDGQSMLAYRVLTDAPGVEASVLLRVQTFMISQYLKVIEGQYLDFMYTEKPLNDTYIQEDTYYEMIGRKTAELVAAGTGVIGTIAEMSTEEVDALYTFGYQLGIAYQICDDTISIWADTDETGKRAYGDILEKKKTLPVLYAYRTLPKAQRQELEAYYALHRKLGDADAQSIVALLDVADSYAYVSSKISEHAGCAKAEIAKLSLSTDQKQTLTDIVDALLPKLKKV